MKFTAPLFAVTLAYSVSTAGHADPTVGTYYYPWWDGSRHTFDDTHRDKLRPQGGLPVIGAYDSRDLWTIASHIDQSRAANISLWVSSWWGPDSFEDRALRQQIQSHPHAGRIKHAIFYESDGRLQDGDNPNWANLHSDFDYLAGNVFNDANYYQVDGKPAAFIYLSRKYLDSPEAAVELAKVRQDVRDKHGMDLYLVGDHVFNQVADGAENFDAVTAYDVYGQTHAAAGGTLTDNLQKLTDTYSTAKLQGDQEGFDLIPTVSPGYNDRQTRLDADNAAAPRYYEDLGTHTFGDPFADQINLAAKPNVDSDVNNLLLVNSFNEWHEDTQIEVLKDSPLTKDDLTDDNVYTQDKFYEGYGTRYLDLLRTLTGGPEQYIIFNGLVGDTDQNGQLDLEDIRMLGEHWDTDSSNLSLAEIANHGDWNLSGVTDDADLRLMVDYLNTAGNNVTYEEARALIPEPTSAVIFAITSSLMLSRRRIDQAESKPLNRL